MTKVKIKWVFGNFIKKELYIIGEGSFHRDLKNKLEINMEMS